jgi:hypothetical protein
MDSDRRRVSLEKLKELLLRGDQAALERLGISTLGDGTRSYVTTDPVLVLLDGDAVLSVESLWDERAGSSAGMRMERSEIYGGMATFHRLPTPRKRSCDLCRGEPLTKGPGHDVKISPLLRSGR